MRFKIVHPGKAWYCPWCGTRKKLVLEQRSAYCPRCEKRFMVQLEQPPDPNSHSGRDHCGKKIRHASIELAFVHAAELKEVPHKERKNLTIYRCLFCNFYHVGHRGKLRRLGLLTKEWYRFVDLLEQRATPAQPPNAEKVAG